jgi:hypothetical protein
MGKPVPFRSSTQIATLQAVSLIAAEHDPLVVRHTEVFKFKQSQSIESIQIGLACN